MSGDLAAARQLLDAQGYTCVLCRGDIVHTTTLRGVRPLLQWLESGVDVRGFSAADKVVGKATAFLYCLLGVREVYAHVMSRIALETLQAQGIDARYGQLVPHIINRAGDGFCPFEGAVEHISDASEALKAIHKKMEELA